MVGQAESRLRSLKQEVHVLWLASRHPKVRWYAKLLAACVLAYALSPVDLIPDFIPVVGHLDDIILVPAGLWLARKCVPNDVLEECRQQARNVADREHPLGWIGAAAVLAVWITLLLLVASGVIRALSR